MKTSKVAAKAKQNKSDPSLVRLPNQWNQFISGSDSRDTSQNVALALGALMAVAFLLLCMSSIVSSKKRTIYVSSQHIPSGTPLRTTHLIRKEADINDLKSLVKKPSAVLGQAPVTSIKEGDPILTSAFEHKRSRKDNHQQISLTVAADNSLDGEIRPGDLIDIFVTRRGDKDEIEGAWVGKNLEVVAKKSDARGATGASFVLSADPKTSTSIFLGLATATTSGTFIAKSSRARFDVSLGVWQNLEATMTSRTAASSI